MSSCDRDREIVCSVAAQSLLLADQGLVYVGSLGREISALGADRHGQLVFEDVVISPEGHCDRTIFIGTSRSFGAFAPASQIQDAAGKVWSGHDIVDQASVSELRFEVALGGAQRSALTEKEQRLSIECLAREGFVSDGQICVRVRKSRPCITRPANTRLWTFRQVGDRVYGTFPAESTGELIPKAAFVDGLIATFGDDTGTCQFDRESSFLAMLVAKNCVEGNQPYVMQFDSLQHSARVGVVPNHKDRHAVARGGCAFVVQRPTELFRISWIAKTWSPICNGLLLSGSKIAA